MLNLDEIEQEISKIESGETTYINLQKLTYLYTVRDHFTKVSGETEFLRAVSGLSTDKVYAIMDGLMTELSTVNPAVYNRTMRKLNRGA